LSECNYDKAFCEKIYAVMCRIRKFEEAVYEVYLNGWMPGLSHLYLGEEAIAAGACAAIGKHDFITSTHRGHGHLVARDADVNLMMSEIMGKRNGYCKGKGGSMHIASVEKGMLGANGIVGGGISIATGAAYMAKYKKTGQVALAFFGDGASNEGVFHESLNMASAWKLPVVFLLENNLYGISVRVDRVCNVEDLAARAKAYDIPGIIVDGQDALAVYEAVRAAVKYARDDKGPSLIECKTYRYKGHVIGDDVENIIDQNEIKAWKKMDALKLFKESMLKKGILSENEIAAIEDTETKRIDAAVEFGRNSPLPDGNEALDDLFVV